jgi:hypothetical protein
MTVTDYVIAEYTPLVLTELLSRRPEWKNLFVESVQDSRRTSKQGCVSAAAGVDFGLEIHVSAAGESEP